MTTECNKAIISSPQCTLYLFFLLGPAMLNVTTVIPPVTTGESIILCTFRQYLFIYLFIY